jgi:type I restriction enzyme S subunit
MIDNEIPKCWTSTNLGTVCKLRNGFAFKSDRYTKEGIPVIRISDIGDGNVDLEYCVKVELDNQYLTYKVTRGDILVAMSGATTGKFGIFKSDQLAFQNQRVGRFEILDKSLLDNQFLLFLLYGLKHKILEDAYGGAQPNISSGKIEEMEIPLPPLAEQHRIVAKIEELFSELDKGIESLKTSQQQLKVYRQAVLKYAFEGEFTATWRKDNPDYSAIDELKIESSQRLQKARDKKSIYYKKIAHDFKFTQHESISSWAKGTLDKLVYIAARIGWRGLKKDEYTQTGPLFLSVHSLNHGKYVDYTEAFHVSLERYVESPEIQIQEGDVLLCKDGAGIGKIGIVKYLPDKATVNSSLLVIRGMNVLNQEFLFYLFSGPVLQKIVFERITGSATPHLFQNDINKFELLIPPYKEQLQIVQEIESRLSVCDKIEESIEQGLQQAEALRQSILKKAFEGKLVPQDPNDEPASHLLERIKAERAAAQPEKKTKIKKAKA